MYLHSSGQMTKQRKVTDGRTDGRTNRSVVAICSGLQCKQCIRAVITGRQCPGVASALLLMMEAYKMKHHELYLQNSYNRHCHTGKRNNAISQQFSK